MRNELRAKILGRKIGKQVRCVLLEYSRETIETSGDLICVVIEFSDNTILIFSCAGDGGISVRTSKVFLTTEDTVARSVAILSGCRLDSAVLDCDSVTIACTGHRVMLINSDDSLSVLIDGMPEAGWH